MDDIHGSIERLYSPGEVALHLDIERQTVTKYARLFENNGYNFNKDEKGNRTYTDTNIMMFHDLIKQRNKAGITLEEAASSLTSIYKSKSVTPDVIDLPAEKESYDPVIEEKLDLIMLSMQESHKQNMLSTQETNKQYNLVVDLVQRIEQKTADSNQLIEKMYNQLQEEKSVREALEKKVNQMEQIIESQKETAAAVEPQKKGLFVRFFGK